MRTKDHFYIGKLHLIKLFAEAKICEDYVTARIQQDILKFQVPVDDAELQKKGRQKGSETRRGRKF